MFFEFMQMNGKRTLINTNNVCSFEPTTGGAIVMLTSKEVLRLKDSYDSIQAVLLPQKKVKDVDLDDI